MASAEDYAAWIVQNQDKKGTLEFDTVAQAYKLARVGAQASEPKQEQSKQEQPKRSWTDELGHQAGLTARHAIEGAAGIVAPFSNALGAAYNLATQYGPAMVGPAAVFGQSSLPRAGTDTVGAVSSVLDRAGLPKPEGGTEEVVGAVSRAIPGAAAVSRAAAATPELIRKAAPVIQQIASRPMAETLSSMLGAGASEGVKQAGGGPIPQAIAGMVAPPLVNVAAGGLKMAATAGREVTRPLTQAGTDQVAADVLGRLTRDKTQALENLNRYAALKELERRTGQEIVGVPGSRPTAGAVSADYGLIGGEQAIARGDAAPQFAQQFAQNNEARLAQLSKLNATQKAIDFYAQKRNEITAPLREAAFSHPAFGTEWQRQGPVNYRAVAEKIGELAASPAGGRVESEKALSWLFQRVDKYNKDGRVDPANAYELQKDIADLVAGKVKDSNGSALRLAGGLANEVKKVLADQIDEAGPGFKKYLQTYARLSKPIERLQTITERLGNESGDLTRVTNAGLATNGKEASYVLSQAKVKNAVNDLKDANLTRRQSDILGSVLADMNAEQLALRGGKMPGSDTYQNIASANLVGRVLGDTIAQSGLAQSAQKGIGLLYKPFGVESRIQDTIVDAYRDPEKMKRLLEMARTSRQSPTLVGTTPFITGGLLGALSH